VGEVHRAETVVANETSRLGKTSLWSSIVGFAVPFSLVVLGRIFLTPQNAVGWQRGLLGLFVFLELAALGCGVAARNTPTGKAGLILSILLLLLVLSTLFVHLHVR
jgi:hypothetical protein